MTHAEIGEAVRCGVDRGNNQSNDKNNRNGNRYNRQRQFLEIQEQRHFFVGRGVKSNRRNTGEGVLNGIAAESGVPEEADDGGYEDASQAELFQRTAAGNLREEAAGEGSKSTPPCPVEYGPATDPVPTESFGGLTKAVSVDHFPRRIENDIAQSLERRFEDEHRGTEYNGKGQNDVDEIKVDVADDFNPFFNTFHRGESTDGAEDHNGRDLHHRVGRNPILAVEARHELYAGETGGHGHAANNGDDGENVNDFPLPLADFVAKHGIKRGADEVRQAAFIHKPAHAQTGDGVNAPGQEAPMKHSEAHGVSGCRRSFRIREGRRDKVGNRFVYAVENETAADPRAHQHADPGHGGILRLVIGIPQLDFPVFTDTQENTDAQRRGVNQQIDPSEIGIGVVHSRGNGIVSSIRKDQNEGKQQYKCDGGYAEDGFVNTFYQFH